MDKFDELCSKTQVVVSGWILNKTGSGIRDMERKMSSGACPNAATSPRLTKATANEVRIWSHALISVNGLRLTCAAKHSGAASSARACYDS